MLFVMNFLIVSNVLHKHSQGRFYAYGPYVIEMNLWMKYVDEATIVAPVDYKQKPDPIDIAYGHSSITLLRIPQFDIISTKAIIKTLLSLPQIVVYIARGMFRADHIHLRCPGNVGLIGCFAQMFFPNKTKTAKYAGNWDWNSKQPWSYRLQQRILRNTFLTRNMTALVYGDWPDKTRNLKTFFTASYSETDRMPVLKQPLSEEVKVAFVGTLTGNKSPLTSLEVLRTLIGKGLNASLTFCGEGPQRAIIEEKISEYGLQDKVSMQGNVGAETVKDVLKKSHFLIFISRSEGWPKAVSEAMWWGCIPITTPVSCVPWMLDNGIRGELVKGEVSEITSLIEDYITDQYRFNKKSKKAMDWSREYTLERFESEIKQLL